MYKISDKVIKFITEVMKNWKRELLSEEETGMKIQRGIFQGDVLLLSQFVVAMIPLNYTLRKCVIYKITRKVCNLQNHKKVCNLQNHKKR